ncbi:MAG: hypothetical protein MK212_18570, partial [Saprospiraceae bacterium]|nr:hypothetical protein [Saprospiraceae bacterium]
MKSIAAGPRRIPKKLILPNPKPNPPIRTSSSIGLSIKTSTINYQLFYKSTTHFYSIQSYI